MHKFGKMDSPFTCNSSSPMQLKVFHVKVTDDESSAHTENTVLYNIYKNRSGHVKTNSEPLLLWWGGNELGQREHRLSCFSIARFGGCRKKVNKTLQINKSNKQLKARLLDN